MNMWETKQGMAQSWLGGLRILRALQTTFPVWLNAQIDSQPLTAQRLLGWTRAAVVLVNDRVPILASDALWTTLPATPELALTNVEAYDDPLQEVWGLTNLLTNPTPATFGLGVAVLLDQESMVEAQIAELEPEEQTALAAECRWCTILHTGEFDAELTLLGTILWWLLKDTAWGLGIDIEGFTRCWMRSSHPTWVLDCTPLPPTTDLPDLCRRLHVVNRYDTDGDPIRTPLGALIPFAVGHTGNPFADHNDWEVAELNLNTEIWRGHFQLTADAIEHWSRQSQEAQTLHIDWFRWNATLGNNPRQCVSEIANEVWAAYQAQSVDNRIVEVPDG